MSIAVSFGRVIQQRRMAMGLNQETLAERAGVHRTYLSDVERGTRNVTLAILERLAESLNMELSVLFEMAEGKSKPVTRSGRRGVELSRLIAEISEQLEHLQEHARDFGADTDPVLKTGNRDSAQATRDSARKLKGRAATDPKRKRRNG
jgi:transcriptional regulator with XRE-family HTH domain